MKGLSVLRCMSDVTGGGGEERGVRGLIGNFSKS